MLNHMLLVKWKAVFSPSDDLTVMLNGINSENQIPVSYPKANKATVT